jgi:hypothetical protein
MLLGSVVPALQEHLRRVKAIHQQDLTQGRGRVELPFALARKTYCQPRMGLAVRFPGHRTLPGGRERRVAATSSSRKRCAESATEGGATIQHHQTGALPHLSPLCRLPDYADSAHRLSESRVVRTRHNQSVLRKVNKGSLPEINRFSLFFPSITRFFEGKARTDYAAS